MHLWEFKHPWICSWKWNDVPLSYVTTEYRQIIWHNTSFFWATSLLLATLLRGNFSMGWTLVVCLFVRLETGMKPLAKNWAVIRSCQFVAMLDTFQGSILFMNWELFGMLRRKTARQRLSLLFCQGWDLEEHMKVSWEYYYWIFDQDHIMYTYLA